ncbi:TPA: hypothetical protein N0F65_000311, partial [Lagenidium giganteum]
SQDMKELQCIAHQYAWGKKGDASTVAQLKAAADASFAVDQTKPYAEYWMGTHPNGPSRIVDGGELLSEWIASHPEATGTAEADIPFLFKVLSVQKALSIQAHPDIPLAKKLHANFPDLYKDPNHKPEMAIAVTRFEALCQFRSLDEIAKHLRETPELSGLVDEAIVEALVTKQDEDSLRAFFRAFIYSEQEKIGRQLDKLRTRLASQAQRSPLEALVLRLYDEYQVDIGVFCPYLLNYIVMEPGEAAFLGANEPHAYLSGDCIECMACSDNVVRAGLTPKFIDKVTLCDMLTYQSGHPSIVRGEKLDESVRLYTSPVPEFEVEAISVAATQSYTLKPCKGAAILLVLSGSATASNKDTLSLSKGKVVFLAAGEQVELIAGADGLMAYRASANERVH